MGYDLEIEVQEIESRLLQEVERTIRRLKVSFFMRSKVLYFSTFFRRSKVEKALFQTFNLLKNLFATSLIRRLKA
jgi:hypothetical protein